MSTDSSETKVMVVAPHPDDEVLGCGGSICVHRHAGRTVQVIFLTSGENASPAESPQIHGPEREREALEAANILGVSNSNLTFLRFPDGGINDSDISQFASLMSLIRQHKPVVMYIPHRLEISHDHQRAYRLAMRAADMAQSSNYLSSKGESAWRVPVILAYEVWMPLSRFQYLEQITPFIEQKVNALNAYRSQSRAVKGQSTYIGPAGVALSAYRGAMALGGYAETFEILRGDTIFKGI